MILRQHPRFSLDFEPLIPVDLNDEEQSQWIFCLAADWPDLVRPIPGKANNPPKIPADPASRTTYHRPQWHFINFPYGVPVAQEEALEAAAKQNLDLDTNTPAKEEMNFNAIQAFKFNANILTTSDDPKAQAVALCWILHLSGDLHQPLHCIALFTPHLFAPGTGGKTEGDRGGNSITWGTGQGDNLHSVWDDSPGPNSEAQQYASIRNVTAHLLSPDNLQAAKAAQRQLDPATWAQESFTIAKTEAYTEAVIKDVLLSDQNANVVPSHVITKPDGYENAIRPTATKRVAEAGFRIAAWLKANPAK